MGLDSNACTPDTVYVTAGALGASAITALAFNVDGWPWNSVDGRPIVVPFGASAGERGAAKSSRKTMLEAKTL